MDIYILKLFSEVMHHRSYTAVALAHGVAPSSISRAIKGLENELGIRLFQRSTRKLVPTEAGLVYFERILPLIDELEAARQLATDVNDEPRGTLRVTVPAIFGQMHVVPLLAEFAEKFPALSVEVLLVDALLDLIEDRIDVAVRLGTLDDSSFIARQLAKMRFYICASPGYINKHGKPDSPSQIKDHECLLFPRAGYNLNWLFRDDQGSVTEITINGKYLLTSSQAIKQCVLNDMGISLLPDWLIRQDIADGGLIRLFPEFEVTATDYNSSIWLVYPSREYLPLKTRVFMDFLGSRLFSGA